MKCMLCVFFILFAFSISAQGVEPEGSGTQEDPYIMRSPGNLEWLGNTTAAWNNHFVQIADIDAFVSRNWNEGAGMIPIGNYDDCFTGSYDGRGFEISNLYMNRTEENDIGLFGWITNATIINTSLVDCSIRGRTRVAGLVSYASYSVIDNCMVSGEVIANQNWATGLVFELCSSEAENCYSNANVTANGGQASGMFYVLLSNESTSNSHYDYETVRVNGEHAVHFGALPSGLYHDWINNSRMLDIDNYLTMDDSEYLITSFDDFEKLLAFGTQEGVAFRLTTDLDFSNHPNFFIPQLSCDFNGGGNTLRNIDIALDDFQVSSGFFCIASDCAISNLYCTQIEFYGGDYGGFLAGLGYDLTVTNCHFDGIVGCEDFAGGFIGSVKNSTFENCSFTGQVSGGYQTGGLFGVLHTSHCIDCMVDAVVTGIGSVAGITGILNLCSSLTRCYSCGEANASGQFAGGIFGQLGTNSNIDECFSSVDVSGHEYVGGFGGNASQPRISNCYAYGDVQGYDYVGGFIGQVLQSSSFIGTINNCYSSGFVHGETNAGGLIGHVQACDILNCFWDIDSSDLETSDGGTGKSSEDMRRIKTYTYLETYGLDEAWDFQGNYYDDAGNEDIWQINATVNDGLPYLTWQGFVPVEEGTGQAPILSSAFNAIYPNPFNPETTISFSVATGETATIEIFNIRGQRVKSFDQFKAGEHTVVWHGMDNTNKRVASGVYFCRLQTGEKAEVRKLMLLK